MNKYGFKGMLIVSVLLVMVLSLAACGEKEGGSRTESKSDVEQLLDDAKTEDTTTEITAASEDVKITSENTTEIQSEENATTTEITTQALDGTNGQYAPNMATGEITTEYPLATGPSQMDGSGAVNPNHQGDEFVTEEPLGEADPNVDVDLTVLSANMVYAEVYNMMMYPDNYLGKTIKVSGPYYPLYYDGTGNYYHYVMIEDALACCQNGMEFIWDEGTHTYPDEYPKEDEVIEIVGELKSYKEENYIYYYLDIEEYKILESK